MLYLEKRNMENNYMKKLLIFSRHKLIKMT